jgi:hypothetical protein
LCGDGRGEKARSISQSFRQVEAHVGLTHGGKSKQISPNLPLSPCSPRTIEASVGAVSKSQTGTGRVACHPTVAAQRAFVILLYHPRPRRVASFHFAPFIHPLISSSADSFFVFLFLNYHTPLSLTINCFLSNNSLNNTSKPHHTVNMKYQLIALPALAATVAAQDLYVRPHESITSQRRFTDSHRQQLHSRRAPDCPPQLSRR